MTDLLHYFPASYGKASIMFSNLPPDLRLFLLIMLVAGLAGGIAWKVRTQT